METNAMLPSADLAALLAARDQLHATISLVALVDTVWQAEGEAVLDPGDGVILMGRFHTHRTAANADCERI
jgi:hypothetical protein